MRLGGIYCHHPCWQEIRKPELIGESKGQNISFYSEAKAEVKINNLFIGTTAAG
jgi:hypothetical protein